MIARKDMEGLLLRMDTVQIKEGSGAALPVVALSGVMKGERIDPVRHDLTADVKAVTLYRYRVEAVQEGWEAEVILDA